MSAIYLNAALAEDHCNSNCRKIVNIDNIVFSIPHDSIIWKNGQIISSSFHNKNIGPLTGDGFNIEDSPLHYKYAPHSSPDKDHFYFQIRVRKPQRQIIYDLYLTRPMPHMKRYGISLNQLNRIDGFYKLEGDSNGDLYIASDKRDITPSGSPLTFQCDTDRVDLASAKCMTMISGSDHLIYSFHYLPLSYVYLSRLIEFNQDFTEYTQMLKLTTEGE